MNVIDQSAANMYLRDDPSMSFACRVYSIFALYVLGNPRVFNYNVYNITLSLLYNIIIIWYHYIDQWAMDMHDQQEQARQDEGNAFN